MKLFPTHLLLLKSTFDCTRMTAAFAAAPDALILQNLGSLRISHSPPHNNNPTFACSSVTKYNTANPSSITEYTRDDNNFFFCVMTEATFSAMNDTGKMRSTFSKAQQVVVPLRTMELHEVDPDVLAPMDDEYLLPRTTGQTIKIAFSALSLVLSIASLMSAAQQVRESVTYTETDEFGTSKFVVVSGVLVYFPLIFSLILILIVNNKRSLDVYYRYLSRGVVIDFAKTQTPEALLTHTTPMLFLVIFFAYLSFSLWYFTTFLPSFDYWLIFFQQLLVGIFSLWLSVQSVDSQLLTFEEFLASIERKKASTTAFRNEADRSASAAGKSVGTLARASRAILKLRLAKAKAAYASYTGKYDIERVVSRWRRLGFRLAVFVTVIILAGSAFVRLLNASSSKARLNYDTMISPCVLVCVDQTASFSYSPSQVGRGYTDVDLVAAACSRCLCSCMTALGIGYVTSDCRDFLSVSLCANNATCQTCKWSS